MKPFQVDLWRELVPILCKLSDDHMTPAIRSKLSNAAVGSDAELYDTLAEVAATPVVVLPPGPPRLLLGDISGFVQTVCDVRKYYERPCAKLVESNP